MNVKLVSIVIPAYNEENNIFPMVETLENVFISQLQKYSYEIIFVNDGSKDGTQSVLEFIASQNSNVKYLEFSRNFGHQSAVKAGLDYAKGDIVISMDGDLQHPPAVIPKLIQKWENGFEIVYTIRTYPKEISYFKKKTSEMFYSVLNKISDIDLTKGGGSDFRLMDRKALEAIKGFDEDDLFLRGLSNWVGFKQTGVEFLANERNSGESSYNLSKMIKFAFSGITAFSVRPLYVSAYIGVVLSILSVVLYSLYVIYAFVVATEISGWASLIMTIVFFGGLQLVMLGIIGLYLGKVFKQVKNRPNYIIRSKNF